MKKLFSLFVLFALCSTTYAEFRSADEALALANASVTTRKFASSKGNKPFRLVSIKNQLDDQTPAFYVLQRDSNAGFMLISAETKSEPIIAYSESGSMNLENAPENVKFWLNRYAKQISLLAQSSYIQPRKMTDSYSPVAPLIGSQWGQGSPYNLKCPMVSSTSTVTGCVATAVSQIMFYHKYPTKGTGSHSYTWNSQTLSVNFANTTYDWGNMQKTYTGSPTTAQKNAVATLMYHVGVSCDMKYGTKASSANTNTAVKSMLTYFGYDPAIRVWKVDYAGSYNVHAAIVKDLQESRPVLFSARTINNEGHAFVCEGLDDKGYLYINWGWSGSSNGYFALRLMDPENQGTGGSASDEAYTEDVTAFTGIRPNQSGSSVPCITAAKATLYSKERIAKNTTTGFSLTTLMNSGVTDWNPVAYLLVTNKTTGSIIAQTNKTISSSVLAPGYYYSSTISVTGKFSTLTAGEYNLGVYVVDGNMMAYPIQIQNKGNMIVPITVTKDSIFLGSLTDLPEDTTPIVVPEIPEFSHIKMINTSSTNNWSIDFNTPLFWKTSSAKNDRLIRCDIVSTSGNAVVGSYVLSTSNAEGTIASGAMYAYGYSNSCKQYTPSELQFTFTAEGEKIVVDYFYAYSNNKVAGQAVIVAGEQDWGRKQSSNSNTYYSHPSPSKELATPMSVSTARSLGSACTDSTYIPFLIKGIVSSDVTLSKGELSFSISDDGTSTNTLKINKCLWLNKTAATASCGVKKGDTVVVYAKLHKVSTQVSASGGYVYSHTKGANTAIEENKADIGTSTGKVLQNGHVQIIRDGLIYDLLGNPVR